MKQLLHFFIIALISSYSVSQNLKSPSEFLGYEIGTEYSRHSQVIDYFEYVTKQMSENVILNYYGETYERRPLMYAVLSSKNNIKDIEELISNIQNSPGSDLFRLPSFCAGCPHNTSTNIPEDSFAFGGIGCHGMATFMPERKTYNLGQMGGEGVMWTGIAPFTETNHIFQNIGDGTYYHSGILAIRSAIASKG